MLKNSIFILLIIFTFTAVNAQKMVQKEWASQQVDTIFIQSNALYSIRIKSEETENIQLETNVEGEVYEAVVVNALLEGRTLQIKTGYSPYFSPKNDKLAAHKVLSIEMQLIIPKDIAVVIFSKTASVLMSGEISYFETALESGNCSFEDFRGDARLFSDSGDINVEAQTMVGGRAVSEKGRVQNELPLSGTYFIEAESNRGDIGLFKND